MISEKLTKYFNRVGAIGIFSCSGMFIVPLLAIAILSGSQAVSMGTMSGSIPQSSGITGNAFIDYVLNIWIMIGMPPSGPIILTSSILFSIIGTFHRNKFSAVVVLIGGILFYLGMYVINSLILATISAITILFAYISLRMKLIDKLFQNSF